MTTAAFSMTLGKPKLLRAIVAGGVIAGTLDIIAAFITFGMDSPKFIAAGLIGRQAIRGGAQRGSSDFFFISSSHSQRPPFTAWPAESFYS